MKKFISVLLSAVLIALIIIPSLSVTSFAAFALEIDGGEYYDPQLASLAENLDSEISNYAQFRSYLLEKMQNCEGTIDISSFKISTSKSDAIRSCIFYDLIEAFHDAGGFSYSYSPSTGCFTKLYFSYNMTKQEYAAAMEICDDVTESFIADLRNNNSLSQAEKALLVHDRIASWCEYDYQNVLDGCESDLSHEMYGTLVDGISVCSGYSRAYKYALAKLGIDCYLCDSDALNHEWTIVVIDGQKYHVDVTWDDPVWDVYGRVNHDNFLRSTAGIVATGHDGGDFDTSPVSTTYDSYYWQNSNTEFQYKNGILYYFDSSAKELKKIDNGETSTLLTINSKWKPSASSYYPASYVRLDSDNTGNYLFYSTPESVCKYDLNTNTSSVVYTPDKPDSYYWIYGFKAQDNYFYLNIYNKPTLNAGSYDYNIIYRYQDDPVPSYTVSFYSTESTLLTSEDYEYGEPFGTLPVPQARTGYVFDGWFTSLNGGTQITENTVMSFENDTDVFAHWHHDGFVVKSNAQYSVDTEEKVIYGAGILTATANTLASCFTNTNITIEYNDFGKLSTGAEIRLIDDIGNVYDTITVAVFGDADGDGCFDGADSVIVNSIVNGIFSKSAAGNAVYMAADCDHDGAITALDVELLENAGIKLAGVEQSK